MSPMHAEFTILLYAMKNSLQLGVTSMSFESDCLQLVKLINDEEDWPAMANSLIYYLFLLCFQFLLSQESGM
uniref:RNase H type-1 domain-containing protein n=2 Tax=Brassica oleracea TaxID=3712 RepID=A0A0D3CCA1_BRAOL|nr:unnamed protein product [Brassica oleracea]